MMTVQEQGIAKWYDDWHQENGVDSWRGESAYPPLVRSLGAKPGNRLLDVGCGTGFFLKAAAENGLDTHGIDVSAEAVKIAKGVSPDSNVFVCSMQKLDGIGPFDFVTALGSLEHCPDMSKALSEIHRVLSPDGRFMAMVPNSKYKGPDISIQEEIMETRKTLPEWSSIFRDAGFTIERVDHDRLMWSPSISLDKTYQFVFTLKKEVRN